MLFPAFTENRDDASLLYFEADGRDAAALRKELESTYACHTGSGEVTKNGKRYVVLEIRDDGE